MKLCGVCGSPEHPEWKAHVFAPHVANTNMANADVANVGGGVSASTYRYRSPEARRKYQAALMRKRRGRA